jgi:TRAP-type C4-dicarboxylate transport system permease large subunit
MWRTMAMFITSFFSFAMFLCWKQAGLPKKFDEREQKIADKAKNIAFTIILFIIIILGSFSMYFKLDIPLNIVLAVLLFVMFFAYKLSYMLFESRPIKD